MAEVEYSIDFTIQDLIDLKAHFGHKKGALNPKMRDYVFGTKNGISIIDIRRTYLDAIRALKICYNYGKMNKKVLFVGTAPQTSLIIKEGAESCNQFYVTDRWLGGILTNWYTVSKSIKTLISYNKILEDTESGLSKKEILSVTKNRDKLMSCFGGLMNLRGRPDLVVVFNSTVDYLAIKEAKAIGIPVIALLDTNADIKVDFPIVANNCNANVISFFCKEVVKAITLGMQQNMKNSGVDISSLMKNKKENSVNNENKDDTEEINDEQ